MFCPECGEVTGPGPIDQRRALHCQCGTDKPTGPTVGLWRAIWGTIRRSKSVEDQPKTINPWEAVPRTSNDQTIRE